jgi:hypothetical protein
MASGISGSLQEALQLASTELALWLVKQDQKISEWPTSLRDRITHPCYVRLR